MAQPLSRAQRKKADVEMARQKAQTMAARGARYGAGAAVGRVMQPGVSYRRPMLTQEQMRERVRQGRAGGSAPGTISTLEGKARWEAMGSPVSGTPEYEAAFGKPLTPLDMGRVNPNQLTGQYRQAWEDAGRPGPTTAAWRGLFPHGEEAYQRAVATNPQHFPGAGGPITTLPIPGAPARPPAPGAPAPVAPPAAGGGPIRTLPAPGAPPRPGVGLPGAPPPVRTPGLPPGTPVGGPPPGSPAPVMPGPGQGISAGTGADTFARLQEAAGQPGDYRGGGGGPRTIHPTGAIGTGVMPHEPDLTRTGSTPYREGSVGARRQDALRDLMERMRGLREQAGSGGQIGPAIPTPGQVPIGQQIRDVQAQMEAMMGGGLQPRNSALDQLRGGYSTGGSAIGGVRGGRDPTEYQHGGAYGGQPSHTPVVRPGDPTAGLPIPGVGVGQPTYAGTGQAYTGPLGGAAAGYGTGATGTSRVDELLDYALAQQQESRTANEQRYGQILDLMSNLGVQGGKDIEERGQRRLETIRQQQISAGLGGTSAGWAPSALAERETTGAKGRLAENVAAMTAGVIERRSDVGPDLGFLAQLMQGYGSSQGALGAVPVSFGGTTRKDETTKSSAQRAQELLSWIRGGPMLAQGAPQPYQTQPAGNTYGTPATDPRIGTTSGYAMPWNRAVNLGY